MKINTLQRNKEKFSGNNTKQNNFKKFDSKRKELNKKLVGKAQQQNGTLFSINVKTFEEVHSIITELSILEPFEKMINSCEITDIMSNFNGSTADKKSVDILFTDVFFTNKNNLGTNKERLWSLNISRNKSLLKTSFYMSFGYEVYRKYDKETNVETLEGITLNLTLSGKYAEICKENLMGIGFVIK